MQRAPPARASTIQNGGGKGGVSDELYEETRKHFDEKELVNLTICVITINGWNRLAISFRSDVGTYQPRKKEERAS
ncbi:MAG: hypothetical protein WBX15_10410 [Thermoanaerobaculia bacterium]